MKFNKIKFFTLAFLLLIISLEISAQTDTTALSKKLILVVYNNSIDSALMLIKQGAEIDYADNNRYTPLMYAVQNNNLDMVKLLAYNSLNLDLQNYAQETALNMASRLGYFDMAEYLCYLGANPDIPDFRGVTPLHFAAIFDDYYLADMLLFYKANNLLVSKEGNSSLHFAAMHGDTALIALLLRNGSVVDSLNVDSITPIEISLQYNHNLAFLQMLNAKPQLQNNKKIMDGLVLTAIHFDNDSAVKILSSLADKDYKQVNKSENPLFLAQHYRQKSNYKTLKNQGYKDSWYPKFDILAFTSGLNFNHDDFYTSFKFNFEDVKYKSNIYLGYGTRFKRKPVLIKESDSVIYQMYERRNFIAAGLDKRVYLLKKYQAVYLYLGFQLQAHFGNYRGSSRNFESVFIPAYQSGIGYIFFPLEVKLGWLYADWKIYDKSPQWITLDIGLQINLISKPSAFTVYWL